MARKKDRSSKKSSKKFSLGNLSRDRKLDIAGLIMVLLGLFTLFGAFSPENSNIIASWLSILRKAFGIGGFLLPIGLIVIGVWLAVRNVEHITGPTLEQAVGIPLLFTWLITLAHAVTSYLSRGGIRELAEQGRGGGYVGGFFFYILRVGFGISGTVISLLAWLILGLAVTLDRPVLGLFGWMKSIGKPLRTGWQYFLEGLRAMTQEPQREPQTQGQAGPVGAAAPASVLPSQAARSEQAATPYDWELPSIDAILNEGTEIQVNDELDRQRAKIIEETLASFSAPSRVVEINRGPTITQFGVEPGFIESRGKQKRVRVNKITRLADDLALALSATRVRVQAPVPGKGFVGIEVPNEEVALVSLRDGITSEAFKMLEGRPLRFALGQDVSGNAVAADLAAMPHLLIAGTTGSGKSVCVNAIISCLLMHNTPDDLRLIMVDPKRVELTNYDGIPHLLAPVVVELERVVGALQWVTKEMDQRYEKFADQGARNLADYNAQAKKEGERPLPYLVVVIDELADLMMLAPTETERAITRMAQLARATGIHMVISTQRPSVDVVTGIIKANFPARIAFATASGTDSRVILDQPGAERLLGRGDMLFQAPDAPAPVRLQGMFVADQELNRLVRYWYNQRGYVAPTSVATAAGGHPDGIPKNIPLKQLEFWEREDLAPEEDRDPLYDEAVDLIRRKGRASISMLQRRLRIGYTRAARLIDKMEEDEIIGGAVDGPHHREVLDYGKAAPPADED
jgi:S-DNA-T family DNA segregation ATPase FtsK/SpoIIIE